MSDKCFHGLSFRQPCAACEQVWRDALIRDLHRDAAKLGFRCAPTLENQPMSDTPERLAADRIARAIEKDAGWSVERATRVGTAAVEYIAAAGLVILTAERAAELMERAGDA